MKRFLILCFVCLPVVASAQKILTGDLKFLNTEHKLHTIVDFSQTRLIGEQENDTSFIHAFIAADSTLLLKRFYAGVVDELENRYMLIGNQPEAKYKAVIHIQQVANDGRTWSVVDFSSRETNENLCTIRIVGDGGRIGTFLSLWGDGLRDTGEQLGKLIKKNTKK